ncbi:MAG: glycosyltransferase [Flavobacteriaceae bacterium]
MKILFVCQQYIHAVRWINQLKNSSHEIYVFDCLDNAIHPDLKWTQSYENWSKRKMSYIKGEERLSKKLPSVYEKVEGFLKVTASEKLEEIIQEINPDLVHSIEMQSETYPLIKVRDKLQFTWAYSSWGSDMYLYYNNKKHVKKIKNALDSINYLFSDNQRDVKLSKELGFKGHGNYIFPGGGGYDLTAINGYMTPVKGRKLILIKGYHHWAGRALTVLKAIELVSEELLDFDIYVYSAHAIVVDKIKELNEKSDFTIEYSSRHDQITHDELLTLFGKSLVAIGNSISDGIPNTLLESILLGAFPIQSNPGKVTEDYIQDGVNGLLISNPEDAIEVSELIMKAIKDNELIERAFQKNQEIAKGLEYELIKDEVLKAYSEIEQSIK